MTISSLASSLQSLSSLQSVSDSSAGVSRLASSNADRNESSGISTLGQYMKQLEELQSSDPEKFKETMSKIAEALEEAAAAATESGDSQQATMLNELAEKFSTSAEDGTMPDLAPPDRGAQGMQGPPPPPPPPSDSESAEETSEAGLKYQEMAALFQQDSGSDPMSVLTGILENMLG